MTELTRSQLSSCKEMDEALKAVEICSEEGLQKFLPYEMWILCVWKSPPSIGLFLGAEMR